MCDPDEYVYIFHHAAVMLIPNGINSEYPIPIEDYPALPPTQAVKNISRYRGLRVRFEVYHQTANRTDDGHKPLMMTTLDPIKLWLYVSEQDDVYVWHDGGFGSLRTKEIYNVFHPDFLFLRVGGDDAFGWWFDIPNPFSNLSNFGTDPNTLGTYYDDMLHRVEYLVLIMPQL